jgi:hypothetical protein
VAASGGAQESLGDSLHVTGLVVMRCDVGPHGELTPLRAAGHPDSAASESAVPVAKPPRTKAAQSADLCVAVAERGRRGEWFASHTKCNPTHTKDMCSKKIKGVCTKTNMKACGAHRERGANAKGVQAIEGKRNVVKNGSVRARLVCPPPVHVMRQACMAIQKGGTGEPLVSPVV